MTTLVYQRSPGSFTYFIPDHILVGDSYFYTPPLIAAEDWDALSQGEVYREQSEAAGPGEAVVYDPHQIVANPEPEDDFPVAYRYLSGTQEERYTRNRSSKEDRIEENRREADQAYIDVQFDPGLAALMDEANAGADERYKALGYTPDIELDNFDPTLPMQGLSAVARAQSMALQERQILRDDVTLSAQQVTDLEASANAHEAIVQAGDPNASVPPSPSFARRRIGVFAEEYGAVIARRVFEGGFWWLEFELRLRRQIEPGQYWLAVYDETATDEPGDPTGYLTTPQLTDMGGGVYRADRLAVNLPRNTPDDVFRFTLCYQHITNEQFDRMTLLAGDEYEFYRVRWAGDIANGAGSVWIDSGQDVTGIVGGSTYNVADTSPFEGMAAGTPIRLGGDGEPETTFNRVHQAGQPGIIVVNDHDAAAVGKRIWHQ